MFEFFADLKLIFLISANENSAIANRSLLLYGAYMSSNQSEAEKDNRLLFREQWILLFSKSKMAEVIFSQSESELKIPDEAAVKLGPRFQ